MQLSNARQPAQIGITTVLLSIIMLYIGVSVSARILRQVQLETARTESTQSFNQAEALIAQEINNGADKDSSAYTDSSVKILDPDDDILYVKKGETISVKLCGEDRLNTIIGNKLPSIYFQSQTYSGVPTTQLLIRKIYKDSGITKSQQQYVNNCPTSYPTPKNGRFYCEIPPGRQTLEFNWGSTKCDRDSDQTVIIMVLGADTYIGMKGLARHYRSASYNSMGNEVRVIEQAETDPSAPGMFQFGVLVNGQITSSY